MNDLGSSSRKQAGPLISPSSPVEDQKPVRENVEIKDLEKRIQQQVAQ